MKPNKGNALENVRRSIQILARYPSQVAILRATRTIIGMQNLDPNVGTDAFVDSKQTKGFATFCQPRRAGK